MNQILITKKLYVTPELKKKKRILLRKLKRDKLEPKYINMFIGLLEFMEEKK